MNWLDLLIVGGIVWGGWSGWRRGLARELFETGAAVLALVLAVRNTQGLADSLALHTAIHPVAAQSITFAGLLLGVTGVGYAVSPHVQRTLRNLWGGRQLERWGGGLVGGLKGALLTLMLIVLAARLPWFPVQKAVDGSALSLQILNAAPVLYESVRTILPRP